MSTFVHRDQGPAFLALAAAHKQQVVMDWHEGIDQMRARPVTRGWPVCRDEHLLFALGYPTDVSKAKADDHLLRKVGVVTCGTNLKQATLGPDSHAAGLVRASQFLNEHFNRVAALPTTYMTRGVVYRAVAS